MTPENKNFMEECADLAKRYSALYEELSGLVSIDSIEGPSVHLMDDCFLLTASEIPLKQLKGRAASTRGSWCTWKTASNSSASPTGPKKI